MNSQVSIDVPSKENDLKFGLGKEPEVLKILRAKENKKINLYPKDTHEFHPFDYYKKNSKGQVCREYEVKSRKVNSFKYPDYGFEKTKWDYALKQIKKGVKMYFIFNLTDGAFLWRLEDPEKQKDEYRFGTICNYVRGDRVFKPAVYVPLKYCRKL